MSEKLNLEELSEEELFQESDPVEKAKKEKKKNKSRIKNMSNKDKITYGGGLAMILVALWMMMDDGGSIQQQQHAEEKKKIAKENFSQTKDIYAAKKHIDDTAPVTDEGRRSRENLRIQEARSKMIEMSSRVKKPEKINEDKSKEASLPSDMFSENTDKSTKHKPSENKVIAKADTDSAIQVHKKTKHITKKPKHSAPLYNKENTYSIKSVGEKRMMCFSLKNEPIYDVQGNQIIEFLKEKRFDKVIDGVLVAATKKGQERLFIKMKNNTAIMFKVGEVFCDMDTRASR